MWMVVTWLLSGLFAYRGALRLGRNIKIESDNGGWEACEVYVYYPTLPLSESMAGRQYTRRQDVALHVLAAVFAPAPLFFLVWTCLIPRAAWWFSQ